MKCDLPKILVTGHRKLLVDGAMIARSDGRSCHSPEATGSGAN